jgi:hypothetical protein
MRCWYFENANSVRRIRAAAPPTPSLAVDNAPITLPVKLCYERSGEFIDRDLLELLYYTSVDCEVRRIDAPQHGPHAVL